MFISREKLDELETRLAVAEENIKASIHREDALMQRFDDLKALNEHLLRELEMERQAAAEYREEHPVSPEEEKRVRSMREQFDEMMNYNGPKFDSVGGVE